MGMTTPIQTCHCFGGRRFNLCETEGWAWNHWYRRSEVCQLLRGQQSHWRVLQLPLCQEQPAPYLEALRTHSSLQCWLNPKWGWIYHWSGGSHLEISESFGTDTICCYWLRQAEAHPWTLLAMKAQSGNWLGDQRSQNVQVSTLLLLWM